MSCLPDTALCAALQRAPAVLFDLFRTLTSVEATNVPRLPEAAPMLGLDQEPLAGAWQAAWEATAEGHPGAPRQPCPIG